jgi:hypothetical protein
MGTPSQSLDADQATIRCLAHVIHLSVIALLVSVRAVKQGDMEEVELDVNGLDLTEDEAETIAGIDRDGDGVMTDQEILHKDIDTDRRRGGGQETERDIVDLRALVQKVGMSNHEITLLKFEFARSVQSASLRVHLHSARRTIFLASYAGMIE